MSAREVWVVEVSDRGANNWSPMNQKSFTNEQEARRRLRDYAEPARERWEYRLTKYTAEANSGDVCFFGVESARPETASPPGEDNPTPGQHPQCVGEKCTLCGEPAHHKIAEEFMFGDDTNRHPCTAYVCSGHFGAIMAFPGQQPDPNHPTYRNERDLPPLPIAHRVTLGVMRERDSLREELERVRAENARLEADLASQSLDQATAARISSESIEVYGKLRESERLVAELRAELVRLANLRQSSLADALHWKAERDECDKENDSLRAELAKRLAVVEAARA